MAHIQQAAEDFTRAKNREAGRIVVPSIPQTMVSPVDGHFSVDVAGMTYEVTPATLHELSDELTALPDKKALTASLARALNEYVKKGVDQIPKTTLAKLAAAATNPHEAANSVVRTTLGLIDPAKKKFISAARKKIDEKVKLGVIKPNPKYDKIYKDLVAAEMGDEALIDTFYAKRENLVNIITKVGSVKNGGGEVSVV